MDRRTNVMELSIGWIEEWRNNYWTE